jgi:hypothetical protein
MDIEFVEPDEIPLSPEEVKFRDVSAELFPDYRRVRITINILPFHQPPDIEIEVTNSMGERVTEATVIGAPNKRMTLTVHLRDEVVEGVYRFQFSLGYQDIGIVDRAELELIIPGSEDISPT